jgi:hypothetical protein
MAREAYRSLYGDLTKLKNRAFLDDPAAGTTFDDALWELLAACADVVDARCNRTFIPRTETLTFNIEKEVNELLTPDLVAVATLKADEDVDGVYEVSWAATDFLLLPANAQPTKAWGRPYTSILALARGTKQVFLPGQNNYQVVGRWGYHEHAEASGATVNETFTSSDVTLTVSSGAAFAIGQTLLISAEHLLITNISGNDLTVVRVMNGTGPQSHASGTAISILRVPPSVERAALELASALWQKDPTFDPNAPAVDKYLDKLLQPYKRLMV